MRLNVPAILIFSLLYACNPAAEEEPPTTESGLPNILLIMTDDQGYGDLSLHGNDSIYTPVLDQLARESVRFDRFYVSPVCAPTRASLLTGRYHLRTGTSWVTHRKEVMRSVEVTLAEYLKEAGYRTGIFGKWHNGAQYPNDPRGQGFDEFFGFCAGHWNNYFDTHLIHNDEIIQTEGYITDALTDAAIDFISSEKEGPFFCYVPYNAPHGPFQVPDRYFRNSLQRGLTKKNAAVYGMCENIDDNVGRLLKTLEEQGLSEETIVLFLTDNGPNGDRYNGGMRGRKAQVHEGGVRVPCFIRWPGHLPENKMVTQPAAHIDLLPTLMDLANLPLDTVNFLDGRSLKPLMVEENPVWEERAIFNVQTDGRMRLFPGAMRTPRYRMVIDRNNTTQLYDMIQDPGQQYDIADQFPNLRDSLRRQYENWFVEVTKDGIDPPEIPIGYAQNPLVELPAPEAELFGETRFKGGMGWANDYVVNWTGPADSINWSVYVVEPGAYAVSVAHTCRESAVGLPLRVSSWRASASRVIEEPYDPEFLPSPDRIDRGEVYEKVWKEWEVGVLELEKGEQVINLSIEKEIPKESLEVKALWVRKLSNS